MKIRIRRFQNKGPEETFDAIDTVHIFNTRVMWLGEGAECDLLITVEEGSGVTRLSRDAIEIRKADDDEG